MSLPSDPICPVCGYLLYEPPRSPVTGGDSYEICPSCGIQFGYSDVLGGDLEARERLYVIWRREWKAAGSPQGWNPGKDQTAKMASEAKGSA